MIDSIVCSRGGGEIGSRLYESIRLKFPKAVANRASIVRLRVGLPFGAPGFPESPRSEASAGKLKGAQRLEIEELKAADEQWIVPVDFPPND
jgi:hypothetical protein